MVAWSFYPRVGGSVTTAMQLSEALLEKGIDVDIIAPLLKRDMYKIKDLNIDNRIKIHWVISSFAKSYIDFYSRFIFFLKMMVKIRVLSEYIDIYHTQGFDIGFLSAIVGTRKPVIGVFGADPLFEALNYKKKRCIDYSTFLKSRVIICLQKIMSIFISIFSEKKLILVSLNRNLNRIIKKYCTAPIVNIPVGINIGLYCRNKAGEDTQKDIILVVSRFMPWKGIDVAIDVFKEIKKYKSDVKIICIGNGPLEKYYFIKYKETEGITFITSLDYKKIIEYYKKAFVLLVTSQYETFGITILEAMASGLPIVASDLTVFHDRICNNLTGYLVKDGNVNDFCNRIIELIEDKKRRREIVDNAFEKVKEYDMNKISNEYIKLYHELQGKRQIGNKIAT